MLYLLGQIINEIKPLLLVRVLFSLRTLTSATLCIFFMAITTDFSKLFDTVFYPTKFIILNGVCKCRLLLKLDKRVQASYPNLYQFR